MIRIYPSPFSNPVEHEPIYSCQNLPGESLLEAVVRLVPTYDQSKPAPWQCKVNGLEINPSRYSSCVLGADTTVDFYLTPRGDIINTVLNVFTLGAWSLVMKFMTPKIASTGGAKGQKGQDDIDQSAAKANTVKQGAVIREKFGEGRIYPDHLVQLRRAFDATDPTKQYSDMYLSLGRGRFLVNSDKSKVGETLQASLGSNLIVRHYEPGADLSAEPLADNYYTSPEVGGTSSGTAGLELTTATDILRNSEASVYVLAGASVTIPSGAGVWPTGWTAGMIIRALTPYSWTVTDGGPGLRDQISGPWDQIGPFVGMHIEVAGGFSGLFTIAEVEPGYVTLSYPDGSPASELPAGTFDLTVGYAGLRFRITSISGQVMLLERLTDTGSTDVAWPGFDTLNSATSEFSLDDSNVDGGYTGPYAATPEGELADILEVDFFYPSGLYKSNSQGNPGTRSVTVEIQYRDFALAGAWTSQQYTHTGKKIEQLGFSPQIVMPYPMRIEARARRITVDSTAGTVSDQVQWYGLKSRLTTRANSYAGISTAAVRVFGGGALAAQAEQMISFWATRILPVRPSGLMQPTRSIAAAALYVARDRGYTDSRIDLAEWDRLDAIWTARGDFFDGSFESETTAEEALNVILRPGYSQLIAPRGILRPVRDALRTETEKATARLYGIGNSSSMKRSGQPVSDRDIDGVNVKWMNPKTWTVETIKCRIPGAPEPKKVTELTLEGVHDRTRAWRLGMRELMSIRYRRWKHSFSTGMDAFASGYMDFVELSDDVPDLSTCGHLRYWNGQQLFESSEPVSDSTLVAMRRPDGTKFGPYPLTRIDDYTFTMAQPLDFTPVTEDDGDRVPTLLFTGKASEMFWEALIASVTPSGQFNANVEALGYDVRVYQFDDAEPPTDA